MNRGPIVPEAGQRCVVIDDLRLRFFIGVHEHEKKARQEVSITIHMFVPRVGQAALGRPGRLRLLCRHRRPAEADGGVHAAHQAGGDARRGDRRAGVRRSARCQRAGRRAQDRDHPGGERRGRHHPSPARASARGAARGRPMPVDVSVIMPAYQASATIHRAAASVLAQKGVTAELVLCADDDLDYGSLLPSELRAAARVTLCRTPAPRSGPVGGTQHRLASRARRHHRLPRCRRCLWPGAPVAAAAAGGAPWRRHRPDARDRPRTRRARAWRGRAAPANSCRSRTSASCACRSRRST